MFGADAVGMCTAHETTIAKHAEMKMFAMVIITNTVVMSGDSDRVSFPRALWPACLPMEKAPKSPSSAIPGWTHWLNSLLKIDQFSKSTVVGHARNLGLGKLGGKYYKLREGATNWSEIELTYETPAETRLLPLIVDETIEMISTLETITAQYAIMRLTRKNPDLQGLPLYSEVAIITGCVEVTHRSYQNSYAHRYQQIYRYQDQKCYRHIGGFISTLSDVGAVDAELKTDLYTQLREWCPVCTALDKWVRMYSHLITAPEFDNSAKK
nr:hypothetical transcript [Hymenolepis microstoma]